jgi:hypothetical protein
MHTATVGDMIIRGVNGEYYPCKPDVFEKTYELVYEDPEILKILEKMYFSNENGMPVRRIYLKFPLWNRYEKTMSHDIRREYDKHGYLMSVNPATKKHEPVLLYKGIPVFCEKE